MIQPELQRLFQLISLLICSSSFYADFGPLNLAMLYRYCCKLNKKLKVSGRLLIGKQHGQTAM